MKQHLTVVRLLLVLAMVASLVAITAAPASAQAVNSVTPTPAMASAPAGYTVNITTTVVIPAGGTITLTFPTGTTLPTTISKGWVSVAGVMLAAIDPAPVVSGQNVIITIPMAAAPLAAGTFNVMISQAAGIKNPPIAATAASNTYIMTVVTNVEPIGTLAYEILPGYSISATSGARGTAVTVTGVGWTPNSSITISNALAGTGTTLADGTFSVTASAITSGPVNCADGAGQTQATPWVGTVAVPTFTLMPTVTVTPSSGKVGSSVTVRGYDFTPGGNIPVNGITGGSVAWGPAVPIALSTIDAYGILDDFVVTITIPLTTTGGAKTVQVTDSAAKTATTTFTAITPTEVWVDDDWAGANPGDPVDGHVFGTDAFAIIQDGIDVVASPGTVHVAAGTYIENVTIEGKSITLRSESGPGSTVIDGGGQGSVVTVDEGADVTIDGFTLRNAGGSYS